LIAARCGRCIAEIRQDVRAFHVGDTDISHALGLTPGEAAHQRLCERRLAQVDASRSTTAAWCENSARFRPRGTLHARVVWVPGRSSR